MALITFPSDEKKQGFLQKMEAQGVEVEDRGYALYGHEEEVFDNPGYYRTVFEFRGVIEGYRGWSL